MRSLVALSIFAVLSLASRASAVALEGSPEFQVNFSTVGEQHSPDLAIDAFATATMVVWHSDHEQKDLPRLYGRIYDASGVPRTGELQIDSGVSYTGGQVVADPAGGFLVVWRTSSGGVFARRFATSGDSLGAAFQLFASASYPVVAARPAGGFFLVWVDGLGLRSAILDGSGVLGPARTLQQGPLVSEPSIAVAPSGGILVTWSLRNLEIFSEDVWARLLDADGKPQGDIFRVNDAPPYQAGYQGQSVAVFHMDGSFSILWQTVLYAGSGLQGLFGRTFVGAGQPRGGIVVLDGGLLPESLAPPAVASDPLGRILVLWSSDTVDDDDGGIFGRFFSSALQPLGDPFLANVFVGEQQYQPAIVADSHGGFTAVWSSGSGYPAILPRGGEGESSQDGSFYGVFGRRFAGCAPGAGHLCLGSGRFRVEVAWTDHDGNSGTGKAVPLTDDTGAFWFFEGSNLELMLKVLDGRGVNGHFWVFYGALSDVRYTIAVTDTLTDVTRTYTNPSGRMASRADVVAFSDPVPPPAAAAAPARVSLPLTPPLLNCGVGPGSTELCLGERFLVSVRFVDPRTGTVGQGQPLALTADTGAFSFFDSDNLELMVKALDGVPVNGHHWIFYGALSDVEYTLTVKDIFTDETRTYRNPAGTMASRGDTGAFPLQ